MFKIYYYKRLPSTQDKAKELLEDKVVVVSETQTRGRGRFHRTWHSKKGGLWFSIVLKLKRLERIPYLTFIAALAAKKALLKVCRLNASIKWPNDLVYENKKICGILTETSLGKEKYAVIGIGLNVNNILPRNLQSPVISLKRILRKDVDKRKILKALLIEFERLHELYKKRRFAIIKKSWERASCMINRKVKVKTLNKTYVGISNGIDKEGNLCVKTKDRIVKVIEGDVFLA